MNRTPLIRRLLRSKEPSIRWRTRVRVLGESTTSNPLKRLGQEIRTSPRVQAMLALQKPGAARWTEHGVYAKWQGPHWVLSSLADLGYPPADRTLEPMVNRCLDFWLSHHYHKTFVAKSTSGAYRGKGVPVVNGRARRCASVQGNALHYATALGFGGPRTQDLAALLVGWQWPDGGWNCDRRPEADTSSFMETLWPMRGLALHALATGDRHAERAARKASEVFLERHLYRRRSDDRVISSDFLRLHFPVYWHYDILAGLKGIAAVGRISDPRCRDALDRLEQCELPLGGWPAESAYYRVSQVFRPGSEYVSWGGIAAGRMNEWVTTDALFVLREAGRLSS